VLVPATGGTEPPPDDGDPDHAGGDATSTVAVAARPPVEGDEAADEGEPGTDDRPPTGIEPASASRSG
jgi:hypothetical protein